ncbi:MAG TPA: DinB family protein [Pyrinomonadaceae bacterium]|nr:DinB family protein [Pyrinomonadaceae bacterium]
MSEAEYIADELREIHEGNAWHGPSLREALDRLKADEAAARPIASAHSIWEIVGHIKGWENVFCLRLEGTQKKEPEEDFPAIHEVSDEAWKQTLSELDETHARLLKVIRKLSDEKLDEMVAGTGYSVRYLLHGIVRHHVYHTGQIALLRKALV